MSMLEILLAETLAGTGWLPVGSICDRLWDYYLGTYNCLLLYSILKYINSLESIMQTLVKGL